MSRKSRSIALLLACAMMLSVAQPALAGYTQSTTDLMQAASKGRVEDVKSMLSSGAYVNAENSDGETALTMASASTSENSREIVEILIKAGADIKEQGENALYYAAENDNSDVIPVLIRAGVDVNATDDGGRTALMYACGCHYSHDRKKIASTKTLKILLDIGANINAKDNMGNTALITALQGWYVADFDYGFDYGLKPKSSYINEEKSKNLKNAIDFLITAGADVNIQDQGGETALMEAAHLYDLGFAVYILIKAGANVNIQDHSGVTALMYAAGYNSPEVVTALLDAGADPDMKDNRGKRAVDYAKPTYTDWKNYRLKGTKAFERLGSTSWFRPLW